MKLNIHNTFNIELPADPIKENYVRQVTQGAFSFVTPTIPTAPKLICVCNPVATLLGFNTNNINIEKFTNIFSGKEIIPNTNPFAMAYAGHQFGNWAGQLGDGRAIQLFEILHNNKRWALQLKGAGKTPYSRRADGLAVLRSSIREYLCAEAMFYLGIPTTRSLSLILSGDKVMRDILYDGNPKEELGAIVCRVAPSFIRFGNFELFATQKNIPLLKQLADYTIKYFFPHLKNNGKETYLEFFKEVINNTQNLIVDWQRVGFVHGVMNTDNMSILGITIDYGPFGFLDNYNKKWTPNTTDRNTSRYTFGNQSYIAFWNIIQLANALYPLIQEEQPFNDILNLYEASYVEKYHQMMKHKLGITTISDKQDKNLIKSLEELLEIEEIDMTIFFRLLANSTAKKNIEENFNLIKTAFYNASISKEIITQWHQWLSQYLQRLTLEKDTDEIRKSKMNTVNPKYILRNYMLQMIIEKAEEGDYSLLKEIETVIANPYEEQFQYEKYFTKRPDWARNKVGSSMLSCSS